MVVRRHEPPSSLRLRRCARRSRRRRNIRPRHRVRRLSQSDTLGSGAYACDYGGGGAVLLDIGGDFVLNGTVSADGGNGGTSSGTSGGSVWIRAQTMSGTGGLDSKSGSYARVPGASGTITIVGLNPETVVILR